MNKNLKKFCILIIAMSLSACSSNVNDKLANEVNNKNGVVSNIKFSKNSQNKKITTKDVLANEDFRRALSYSINRNYIARNSNSFENKNIVAKYLYDLDENKLNSILEFDGKKAKEYLKKSKEELGFDEITLKLLSSEFDEKIAKLFKKNIETKLPDIKIDIEFFEDQDKIKKFKSKDYDLFLNTMSARYPDPLAYLENFDINNKNSFINYKDEKLMQLFEDLNDIEKNRNIIFNQIENLLINDYISVLPLVTRKQDLLLQPIISNYSKNLLYNLKNYQDIQTVYLTKDKFLIRLGIENDLNSFDILKSKNNEEFEVNSLLNATLFRIKNDKIENDLVEDYEISEDGLLYTLNLKKSLMWSNSDILSAYDVKDGFYRLIDFIKKEFEKDKGNENFKSDFILDKNNLKTLLLSTNIKNIDEVLNGKLDKTELGIEVVNDNQLKIILNKNTPYLTKILTNPVFCPVNLDFINETGEFYGIGIENSISSGAYKLSKIDIGHSIYFEKNKNYNHKIENDGVVFKFAKDKEHLFELYNTNQVDLIYISDDLFKKYKENKSFKEESSLLSTFIIINF